MLFLLLLSFIWTEMFIFNGIYCKLWRAQMVFSIISLISSWYWIYFSNYQTWDTMWHAVAEFESHCVLSDHLQMGGKLKTAGGTMVTRAILLCNHFQLSLLRLITLFIIKRNYTSKSISKLSMQSLKGFPSSIPKALNAELNEPHCKQFGPVEVNRS